VLIRHRRQLVLRAGRACSHQRPLPCLVLRLGHFDELLQYAAELTSHCPGSRPPRCTQCQRLRLWAHSSWCCASPALPTELLHHHGSKREILNPSLPKILQQATSYLLPLHMILSLVSLPSVTRSPSSVVAQRPHPQSVACLFAQRSGVPPRFEELNLANHMFGITDTATPFLLRIQAKVVLPWPSTGPLVPESLRCARAAPVSSAPAYVLLISWGVPNLF
jgi:hypothetical protein